MLLLSTVRSAYLDTQQGQEQEQTFSLYVNRHLTFMYRRALPFKRSFAKKKWAIVQEKEGFCVRNLLLTLTTTPTTRSSMSTSSTEEYAFVSADGNGNTANLDEATIEIIQKKMIERSRAKANREYRIADDIRDELRKTYQVNVNDRTREWKIGPQRQQNNNNEDEVDTVLDSLNRLQLSSTSGTETASIAPTDASKSASSSTLKEELQATHFTIFEDVIDLGYFGWCPTKSKRSTSKKKYHKIQTATATEIKSLVDVDGQPDALVDIAGIQQQLPIHFPSLPPQKHMNKFPYEVPHIASLHVVANYRRDAVDLAALDFVFGGSTLQMLATGVISGGKSTNYVACKVPHTNAIVVKKHKIYNADYADMGFQFERLVTGFQLADRHNPMAVEHLQVIQMRGFQVLFSAEADAVDESETVVEIKASNPKMWGSKTMFQMISSGSTKLCVGTKSQGTLTRVAYQSLRDVASKAVRSPGNVAALEDSILGNMTAIQERMKDYEPGVVVKIQFHGANKTLELAPINGVDLLPAHGVVEELLVVG
jgi:hypothetical protein